MALTEYLSERNCRWAVTRMDIGKCKGLYRLRVTGRLGLFDDGEKVVNEGGPRC